MNMVFAVVLAVITIAYPLLVYWGLQVLEPRAIGLVLLAFLLARVITLRQIRSSKLYHMLPILAAATFASLLGALFNQRGFLLLNPVFVGLSLFLLFAATLVRPPAYVERFARIDYPVLPPAAVVYCRQVTLVWALFFLANALVSLWLALWSSLEAWTFYTGFLGYVLMAFLGASEYVIRKRKDPEFKRSMRAMEEAGRKEAAESTAPAGAALRADEHAGRGRSRERDPHGEART